MKKPGAVLARPHAVHNAPSGVSFRSGFCGCPTPDYDLREASARKRRGNHKHNDWHWEVTMPCFEHGARFGALLSSTILVSAALTAFGGRAIRA